MITIRTKRIFPEAMFYINWAKKSKNKKTKRKLLTKALKEVKCVSKNEIRRRIFKQKYSTMG